MEDTFPFLMKIGILIFLYINNLKIFNIFIFKTQEKFKWNNNIHKKLLDWKWIHPKLFFLSLEKDREVVIGGTIPKSGADVSFTVVRARLQICIYR